MSPSIHVCEKVFTENAQYQQRADAGFRRISVPRFSVVASLFIVYSTTTCMNNLILLIQSIQ